SEAEQYLDDRVAKRFTVIQAHILPWTLQTRHVHGQTAFRYGQFLGNRYRANTNLIWVLGGDRRPTRHGVYRQLARGLTETYANGDPNRILLTYHPPGGTNRPPATSSGEFYHRESWMDLNMIQSGYALANASYQRISEDYARLPAKPTFDSEPCYEQHPIKHDYKNGRFTGWHVRRRAWWSVLAGACGFTYGGNGIWQMDKPGDLMEPDHFSHFWYDGLSHEGTGQMQHVRTLVETLGVDRLVPDRGDGPSTRLRSPAGTVDDRVQVARDRTNNFLVAYITDGHPITLDLSGLTGKQLSGFWFDPRTGARQPLDKLTRQTNNPFTPPTTGPEKDWVLVVMNRGNQLR
ncbi:MAG: glycoside hydrolase family 140 protein, partial [Cytophagaceae bacterium]|nr:glycoside hydrolase family 140 protein [Cytophagaceae bacterium]